MSERLRIGRVLAEFVLIVLGVAAALGVDRWVQGIDDARAEEEYLWLVLADVEANAGIFRLMVSDWEASRDASAALKGALETRRRPPDSGLLMAVARAGTVNTIPARDASFRDLEATGNVRLISDKDLRAQIVAYFTQDIRFGRPIIEDRLDLRFRSFARERVPVAFDDHRGLCPATIPAFECDASDPPRTDALWSALLDDSEMQYLLQSAHVDAISGADVAQFWLERTDSLQSSLQRALGS